MENFAINVELLAVISQLSFQYYFHIYIKIIILGDVVHLDSRLCVGKLSKEQFNVPQC